MKETEEVKEVKNNERKQKKTVVFNWESENNNHFNYCFVFIRFYTFSHDFYPKAIHLFYIYSHMLHPACINVLILDKDRWLFLSDLQFSTSAQ